MSYSGSSRSSERLIFFILKKQTAAVIIHLLALRQRRPDITTLWEAAPCVLLCMRYLTSEIQVRVCVVIEASIFSSDVGSSADMFLEMQSLAACARIARKGGFE